jgi:hypothetical protein
MVDLRGITNDTHYAGLKITAWSYCNFNFGHTGIDLNSLSALLERIAVELNGRPMSIIVRAIA